jgi:hypothetical protein
MKIQLKGRAIPRVDGDPKFVHLNADDGPEDFNSVMTVFTAKEVVELVNRALYQLEYQHNAHRVRGQRERDREKAIKQKVKELFHVSWMKATEEQVKRAREEVEREKGG